MQNQLMDSRSPLRHVAVEADGTTEPGTSYAEGTEALQFALSDWKARGDEFGTHDVDGVLRDRFWQPFVRPRVAGDAVLGCEIDEDVDFVVFVGFPNVRVTTEECDASYVYTRLKVAEVLAYDGRVATVRTDNGCVFFDVRVIWPIVWPLLAGGTMLGWKVGEE